MLQLRSKRWRVAPRYRLVSSQGEMPAVIFRADNVGERPVTLTNLRIGLGRRRSWTTKLARAVHPFNRLYGIDETESFGTYGVTHFLPKELPPGASLFLELDGEEILNWATSQSKSGSPADRVTRRSPCRRARLL